MKLQILRPFDAHLHLRTGNMAKLVTNMSVRQFSDVIVMPNLKPPITTITEALKYQTELLTIAECNFHMALYLTNFTTLEDVKKVASNPNIIGFKLYPLNATTGSHNGVSDIKKLFRLFREMERLKVPLMIHGEVTRKDVDIFDRETIFLEEVLTDIVENFPRLIVTLEHITTADAVEFVLRHENVVATITAHHLLINRNAIFSVGENTVLNPHAFCLPIAKTERDRMILLQAATSGNPKFFAGTDSAPHPLSGKESNCGCAGCFTGFHALELYATAFEQLGRLNKLEDFLSIFGRLHYGLEIPCDSYTELSQESFIIPNYFEIMNNGVPLLAKTEFVATNDNRDNILIPFWAGQTLNWKFMGAYNGWKKRL